MSALAGEILLIAKAFKGSFLMNHQRCGPCSWNAGGGRYAAFFGLSSGQFAVFFAQA